MNFIIFDMEWNSTKINETDGYLNEIIEIGAVKLDEKFNVVSDFSEFVKPVFGTKLNRFVTGLTHINQNQLKNANDFETVINNFSDWAGDCRKNIFLSWSNTDLHVLLDNYKKLLKKTQIEFIAYYCDLQKYIERFMKTENGNQVALAAAAEFFKIDITDIKAHRAHDDSIICARLLENNFDSDIFEDYVHDVFKNKFYDRLMFKPYYITDINSSEIDKSELKLKCPVCKHNAKLIGNFRQRNNAIVGEFVCNGCKKKYFMNVRFKKTFDRVIVSKTVKPYVKKTAENQPKTN